MRKFALLTTAAMFAATAAIAHTPDRPTQLSIYASTANEAEITQNLQSLGYTDLQNVRLSGDVYTADAMWNGTPVRIRINAEIGRISNTLSPDLEVVSATGDVSKDEMKAALEDIGYRNVRDMIKAGQVFRTTAERGGREYKLRIDASTGEVTTGSDRGAPSIGNAEKQSDQQVIDNLASQGFTNGHDVNREGNIISVKATHAGKPVDLNIEADSGIIVVVD